MLGNFSKPVYVFSILLILLVGISNQIPDDASAGDGDSQEISEEEPLYLKILYIILPIGAVIALAFSEHIIVGIVRKIRHRKNRGTYSADGKKITGALPKGYSDGGRDRSEIEKKHSVKRKKKLWKYELAITAIGIFTALGMIIGGLADPEYVEEHNAFFIPIWFYTSFGGIPLMILVIKKYRTLEQEQPSGLTKMYYSGRAKKQCTICEKHPVSKKYHINSEHKMQNVDVNDYFIDCGCDICASYNSSGG